MNIINISDWFRDFYYFQLRAASVRECMESVLEDLERGVDSTGDDVTVDGQRVTDGMKIKILSTWSQELRAVSNFLNSA